MSTDWGYQTFWSKWLKCSELWALTNSFFKQNRSGSVICCRCSYKCNLENFKKLGIAPLSFRRRLFTVYKIKTQGAPKYLYKLKPFKNNTHDKKPTTTLSTHSDGTYYCRTNAFKYSFFPYFIREWSKLDLQLRNAESFKKFGNTLLKLVRAT